MAMYGWPAMAGATIDEVTLADEPGRWAGFGFDVRDGVCELGRVRLRLAGADAGSGIVSWALRNLQDADLDGLPTTGSDAPERAAAGEHPNGIVAIDHIVAVSPSFERSVAAIRAAGLDLRRVREEPTPAGAPRQAFFRLGAEILELVAEPDEVVQRRGGPDRPVQFWGLALVAPDIERAAAAFAPHVGEVRPAVQPGRSIATVKRSAGLAVPLALMTPPPDR